MVCKKDFPNALLSDEKNTPLQHFHTYVMGAADRVFNYCIYCDCYHDVYLKNRHNFCPLKGDMFPPIVNIIRKMNGMELVDVHDLGFDGPYMPVNRAYLGISPIILIDNSSTASSYHSGNESIISKSNRVNSTPIFKKSSLKSSKLSSIEKIKKTSSSTSLVDKLRKIENDAKKPNNKIFIPENISNDEKKEISQTATAMTMSKRLDDQSATLNLILKKLHDVELYNGRKNLKNNFFASSFEPFKNSRNETMADSACQTPKGNNPLTTFIPAREERANLINDMKKAVTDGILESKKSSNIKNFSKNNNNNLDSDYNHENINSFNQKRRYYRN